MLYNKEAAVIEEQTLLPGPRYTIIRLIESVTNERGQTISSAKSPSRRLRLDESWAARTEVIRGEPLHLLWGPAHAPDIPSW